MRAQYRHTILLIAVMTIPLAVHNRVFAQDNVSTSAVESTEVATDELPAHKVDTQKPKRKYKTALKADQIPSLFFTYWQHQAILDSKNSKGLVNPPSDYELNGIGDEEENLMDPGPRDIVVGGIVYNGKSNWTVWLNGQRVTPNAVPKEILDLKVYENYLEIKWLDKYTGQIFPIRIRSHERFNLDTRMFLPG